YGFYAVLLGTEGQAAHASSWSPSIRADEAEVVRADGTEASRSHDWELHAPSHPVRMLDHWDNLALHPVMGQVERGYAGGSLFYEDGELREDLSRVEHYARL